MSKKIEKFGVQASTSPTIHVFRNGDKHHTGVKVVLNSKILTIEQLKEKLGNEVSLPTGPVRKIFSTTGVEIKSLGTFENGKNYIAVGGEGKIDKERYPLALSGSSTSSATKTEKTPKTSSPSTAPKASPSSAATKASSSSAATKASSSSSATKSSSSSAATKTSSPIAATKKPVVENKFKGEKFGVQAERPPTIHLFRHGDKHHQGEKLILNAKKWKTFDQFLVEASNIVKLPTGAVRKIFTKEGKMIKALDAFEDGHKYVCVAGEPLDKSKIPPAML